MGVGVDATDDGDLYRGLTGACFCVEPAQVNVRPSHIFSVGHESHPPPIGTEAVPGLRQGTVAVHASGCAAVVWNNPEIARDLAKEALVGLGEDDPTAIR